MELILVRLEGRGVAGIKGRVGAHHSQEAAHVRPVFQQLWRLMGFTGGK